MKFNPFFSITDSWKWLNKNLISHGDLNLSNYWNENDVEYGKCGSIVLLDTNQVILRSVTCKALEARFICSYSKFSSIGLTLR